MDTKNLLKRIAKLEGEAGGGSNRFKMPNGEIKAIHRDRVGKAFADGLEGLDTPETRILLGAVSCGDGSKLHTLLQMVCN